MVNSGSSVVSFPASSHAVINGSFYRDPSYSVWSTVYVNSAGNLTDSGPFTYPKASTPFVAAVAEFYDVVGEGATLEVVAQEGYAAFHEAGVYIPSTNEVYFTSNQLTTTNTTEYRFPTYAQFNRISLAPSSNGSYEWNTVFPPSSDFIMPNGGTIYDGKVLMATQGYGLQVPSSLVLVDPATNKGKTILNNFYGRLFTSINDVAVLYLNKPLEEQGADVFGQDQGQGGVVAVMGGNPPVGIMAVKKPFVAVSKDFYDIVGPDAKLEVIAEERTAQFHEAGVYIHETNEVFFTSNKMNRPYPKGPYGNFSKIRPDGQGSYKWEILNPSSDLFVLPNGGTTYNGKVLMAIQGYKLDVPSSLVIVDPKTLHTEVLVNNYFGRPFNSLNDVVVLMRPDRKPTKLEDQWIFFTDPPYGYHQGFKEYPRLPSQVYAFHPPSGSLRVVADGFQRPNGIVFSPDMRTCYITDTGFASAEPEDPRPLNGSRPGTIYAYDVVHSPEGSAHETHPPALTNRRLFAFTDCGMPDGIKCDTEGNVYAGCFDGVHVWNKHGALVGKILLGLGITLPNGIPEGRGCANLVFVPGGLLMFAEDRMYLATIKAKGALLEGGKSFVYNN
ncbi:hypothetical protein FRC11_003420 [Ceratobasidium sp. 423]|nr:hypothetical protein FRC11_003420 [Ceratobasidium sp. 423]